MLIFHPGCFLTVLPHPSYFAARSATRHYRRYFARDQVFVADLSDYSNYIDQKSLQEKLKKMGLADNILQLLNLFIGNKIVREGKIEQPKVGLVQGVPLIALFNNLYLDDFDKWVGPQVDFFRRVGDDLLVFDRREELLIKVKDHLELEAERLGLKINRQKTKLISAREDFNFLGYAFRNGLIGLEKSFCAALLKRWRARFSYYRFKNPVKKFIFLKKTVLSGAYSLSAQFQQIAEQKKLVTDMEQVKDFSEAFFRILTKYFYQNYSEKNRRLLKAKIKNIQHLSLYKYFVIEQNGNRKRTN